MHTRCCSEEAHGFCLECTGATDEELFDWVNDLKWQAQAARCERAEAAEREAAERQAWQEEEDAAAVGCGAEGKEEDGQWEEEMELERELEGEVTARQGRVEGGGGADGGGAGRGGVDGGSVEGGDEKGGAGDACKAHGCHRAH